MKAHKGGLMAYLNSNTQEKAKSVIANNTSNQDVITFIDVHDLIRNERNFYGIRDVEELASMIATSGVVEPLTVTPNGDGKYRIVAGERRASATLLRLERGDLIDPNLPCIVKTFTPSGSLDASDMEMICLIVSNRGQRQTRTALEKLREIEELEPIVKKIYKDEHIQGSFRRFFADNLSISDAQLQRLKRLVDLIPDAQHALEMGILSDTAAMELALHSVEEQAAYIKALIDDDVKSRVKDIKEFFGAQEEIDPTDNEFDDDEIKSDTSAFSGEISTSSDSSGSNNEPMAEPSSQQESKGTVESEKSKKDVMPPLDIDKKERKKQDLPQNRATNATINIDVPIPKDINGEQMEREADSWIEKILRDSIEIAVGKTKEAREAGDTRTAALWDSRRAKAVLVLETVRE